jgi:hypothetical protein
LRKITFQHNHNPSQVNINHECRDKQGKQKHKRTTGVKEKAFVGTGKKHTPFESKQTTDNKSAPSFSQKMVKSENHTITVSIHSTIFYVFKIIISPFQRLKRMNIEGCAIPVLHNLS